MKKLMLTAVLATIAGVACAVETYDYKASVKHTYIRTRNFRSVFGVNLGATVPLYVKYTKTSSLEGFLIQDDTGVLRTTGAVISSADLQPGNRCFLVARNRSAERNFRFPRIVPGVIEAKWYEDRLVRSNSKPAQGILYLGGEVVNAYRGTTFNALDGIPGGTGSSGAYTARAFTNWQRLVPVATVPTIGIDDYWFTSCYLFGQYNQPAWVGGSDIEEFGDAWLNHAGIGKAVFANNLTFCCGRGNGGAGTVLDSLAGNLKAGIYLCSENGEDDTHTAGFNRTGIAEDQLWIGVAVNDPTLTVVYPVGTAATNVQKLDMWADGNLDLGTTDVGFGTWSIKRTTRLLPVALTAAENATITGTWALPAPAATRDLMEAIKGAMVRLDSTAALFGDPVNGNEMINFSFYSNYLRQ